MLGACAYSDWACKCEAQKTIVSCFNTCPGDETRAAQEGQVKVFCNASKPASSSSSAAKKAKSSAVNKSSENADSAKPTASVEDSGKKVAKGKPLVTQNPTSGEDEVKAAKPKDVKGDDDGTVASGAAAVKASVAVLAVGCAALALF
ncbi:hypothetical protein FBU59_000107 [Linderina macrospora]|uniref:Uncharacterized protein n=1 Tax=Linderina macrospora TaxID=4868 RepID=A0ACC1JHS1_9FUNG|nr:hypothetical protein FBU59_000107 [Linderina macrospora]